MQDILAKLMNPGVGLIVIGAVFVYGSSFLTKPFRSEIGKGDKLDLISKIFGTVLAIIGAVMVFTLT